MKELTRQSTIQETLQIAHCPCCEGEIDIIDCGYSSFNVGLAECNQCSRKWSISYVIDTWDTAQQWNKLSAKIKERLRVISLIKIDRQESHMSSHDIDELLEELEEYIITQTKCCSEFRL